jgi:phosphatidylglycerol---prolipoprotein diacylglyceryl transferase
MYPVLIRFGPFTIHTYGFLLATAFLTALCLAVSQARKRGIAYDKIVDQAFYTLVAGLAGSRLFFVATNWPYYAAHPLDIVKIWEGGLVFYGGVLLALPTAVWLAKKEALPLWEAADIWAPSIALGHAIGRLGCFCAGCCYGKPAEGLPWAVIFRNQDSLAVKGIPLHPAQLYESAGEVLNFLILITLRRRQAFGGQLFWVYILNYSIIRSVVEIFRGDEVRGFIAGGVSISQGISVAMFASSLLMLRLLGRGRPAGT